MVFCMVITSFVVAGFPIYFELALFASVTDPIEAHINGLCVFLFDGVFGESYGLLTYEHTDNANPVSLWFALEFPTVLVTSVYGVGLVTFWDWE